MVRTLILCSLVFLACSGPAPERTETELVEDSVPLVDGFDAPSVDSASDELDVQEGGGDWVDSLDVPAWVRSPRESRAYAALVPAVGAGSEIVLEPPSLVRRVRARTAEIVEGWVRSGTPESGRGQMARIGNCDTRIAVDDRGRGAIHGPTGTWLITLAAVEGSCDLHARLGFFEGVRDPATIDAVVRNLGDPFRAGDLVDHVESPVLEDGSKIFWGVARSARSGQIAPPPVVDQIAFMARVKAGHAVILWSQSLVSDSDRLALAGVYDLDGDGIVEGIFGILRPEVTEILSVGKGPDGWGLLPVGP